MDCLHDHLTAQISIGNELSNNDETGTFQRGTKPFVFNFICGSSMFDGLYVCDSCRKKIRINVAVCEYVSVAPPPTL